MAGNDAGPAPARPPFSSVAMDCVPWSGQDQGADLTACQVWYPRTERGSGNRARFSTLRPRRTPGSAVGRAGGHLPTRTEGRDWRHRDNSPADADPDPGGPGARRAGDAHHLPDHSAEGGLRTHRRACCMMSEPQVKAPARTVMAAAVSSPPRRTSKRALRHLRPRIGCSARGRARCPIRPTKKVLPFALVFCHNLHAGKRRPA
jgi:hypothetical protein